MFFHIPYASVVTTNNM